MTNFYNIIDNKRYASIISFSLIISENYFFLWNKRFFLHPSYLFFNTLFLFIFSFLFFLVIIGFLNKIKDPSKIKQFIIILIFSYILVRVFETILFYSNITTLSIIFENLLSVILDNNTYILFLKKIFPYLITFLTLIFFFKNKFNFIQKFIFSFSIIFLLILVYHTSLRYYNYEKVDLNSYNNSSQKKVIWMVLDEFDPSIAFTNINQLINFEKLKENSILIENSYSPSSHTLESLPSIFMSRDIKEIKYLNNKLYLRDNILNKEKIFNFKNTFFSDLKSNEFNFNLYSEVLPYCFMLGLENNCKQNKNKFSNYFNGIIFSYTPLSYINKIRKKNIRYGKFNIEELHEFNENYNISSDFIISEKLKFNFEDFEKELNSENNFTFIHLFLPKENVRASEYVKKFYNKNSENNFEKYQIMLKYTDLIIKGINQLINKYDHKDIMLILSSDHWYRELSNDIKPSLFVTKIFNDKQKIVNDKKVMNIFIPDLILKYLDSEINNHSDIDKFVNSLDNIDTNLIRNNLNEEKNLDYLND